MRVLMPVTPWATHRSAGPHQAGATAEVDAVEALVDPHRRSEAARITHEVVQFRTLRRRSILSYMRGATGTRLDRASWEKASPESRPEE